MLQKILHKCISNTGSKQNNFVWCTLINRTYASVPERRVVVTGIGLLSCLGCGTQHVWKKLLNGESGISSVKYASKCTAEYR